MKCSEVRGDGSLVGRQLHILSPALIVFAPLT